MRQQQGHHELDMAGLYARDDTIGALRLQQQVLRALLTGLAATRHPGIAIQGRGASAPLPEPSFTATLASFRIETFAHLLSAEADWGKLAQEAAAAMHDGGASPPKGSVSQDSVLCDQGAFS